jgi:hypothetical protein
MKTKYQPSGKATYDQFGWNTKEELPLVHSKYNVGVSFYSAAFIVGAVLGILIYVLAR